MTSARAPLPALLACAVVAGACGGATPAAAPPHVYRVGFLSGTSATDAGPTNYDYMRQALGERGYVEGQNVAFDARFSEGDPTKLPGLAAELVALKPDVILVQGNNVALSLKPLTTTIPIVVWASSDPVEAGVVASLAQPGGNITAAAGASGPDVVGKRLQLFKDAIPSISRVAYLYDSDANHVRTFDRAREFASQLGFALIPLLVRTPEDVAPALASITNAKADAIFVSEGALLAAQRSRILQFAASNRLPSMLTSGKCDADGCLMVYAESNLDGWRRVADYTDRILRTGAKPADLPIVPSAKLDLAVNLRSARTLGITIPKSVVDQATEVIQ